MNFDETMMKRLTKLEREVERLRVKEKGGGVSELLNKTYPIGAIYMSVSSTNPGTLFGGTWVAWGAGRVPVGIDTGDTDFDTVEETGGAKTHTLTTGEIMYTDYGLAGGAGSVIGVHDHETTATAHNNLQPYIVCYMWKRTA